MEGQRRRRRRREAGDEAAKEGRLHTLFERITPEGKKTVSQSHDHEEGGAGGAEGGGWAKKRLSDWFVLAVEVCAACPVACTRLEGAT
jgi:hypothetical protein